VIGRGIRSGVVGTQNDDKSFSATAAPWSANAARENRKTSSMPCGLLFLQRLAARLRSPASAQAARGPQPLRHGSLSVPGRVRSPGQLLVGKRPVLGHWLVQLRLCAQYGDISQAVPPSASATAKSVRIFP